MSKLPEKPSELIRVALEDMRATEQVPRYIINMDMWHFPAPDGICEVCAAGAVMARRLGADPKASKDPADFGGETSKKLLALNLFRAGLVHNGLRYIDIAPADYPTLPSRVYVTPYQHDREAFYRDMEALAAMLEGVGL